MHGKKLVTELNPCHCEECNNEAIFSPNTTIAFNGLGEHKGLLRFARNDFK